MSRLGSTILRFETLASTNDYAREIVATGASEGTAVLADQQTAGRGRQGRQWASPAGEGLYLSVIARPKINPSDSAVITLAAAVAVAETFSIDFKTDVDIKWPNDVMASGKKICGILVESAIETGTIQYAVIGIGVNLAQSEFPADIRGTATSLLMESGSKVSTDAFLTPLLERLDRWYNLAVGARDQVIDRWENLSSYARGCAVRIESADGAIEGITRGLAPSGALVVELEDGNLREIVSGEIKLRKSEVRSPVSEVCGKTGC